MVDALGNMGITPLLKVIVSFWLISNATCTDICD